MNEPLFKCHTSANSGADAGLILDTSTYNKKARKEDCKKFQ